MKAIALPKNARILVGAEPVDLHAAIDEHRQVQRNALEIIGSAMAIEKHLALAFSYFLLGGDIPKREFLDEHILSSDWCSFAAKRKLVNTIIGISNTLTPEQASVFDASISKTMKYRNAFAHGEVTQSNRGMTLRYFEGRPVTKDLTDAYWGQVVADFRDAHEKVNALLKGLGAIKDATAS